MSVSRQRASASAVAPHDGRLRQFVREGRGCVLCGVPWQGVVAPPGQTGGEAFARSRGLSVRDAHGAVTWCIPAEMSLSDISAIGAISDEKTKHVGRVHEI